MSYESNPNFAAALERCGVMHPADQPIDLHREAYQLRMLRWLWLRGWPIDGCLGWSWMRVVDEVLRCPDGPA